MFNKQSKLYIKDRMQRILDIPSLIGPCHCGYLTEPYKACRSTPDKLASFIAKIAQALLNKIDIYFEIVTIEYKELTGNRQAEPSLVIKGGEKALVVRIRRFQLRGHL